MPEYTREILSVNPDPSSQWKALNDFKGSGISPIVFQTLKPAIISGLLWLEVVAAVAIVSYENFMQLLTNFYYLCLNPVNSSYVYNIYGTVIYISRLATESNLNHNNTGKLLQGLKMYTRHYACACILFMDVSIHLKLSKKSQS